MGTLLLGPGDYLATITEHAPDRFTWAIRRRAGLGGAIVAVNEHDYTRYDMAKRGALRFFKRERKRLFKDMKDLEAARVAAEFRARPRGQPPDTDP